MQLILKNKFLLISLMFLLFLSIYLLVQHNFYQHPPTDFEDSDTILDIKDCGDSIGSLNGVIVYLNSGGIMSCDGARNLNGNGYSYGIKWQCVEFVRRYYYDYLNHEMPSRNGHASDYFRDAIRSGSMNSERDLLQYHNGDVKPKKNDILIWPGTYGHVAIITNVTDTTVSTIAQNVGEDCTEILSLNGYTISGGCVGLLRKETI